jgi:hypothetical protein
MVNLQVLLNGGKTNYMGDQKKCCPDPSELTLRRIVAERKEWSDARGHKVAEIIAEIQGPTPGSKCCPDAKGKKPAIVFILKLDSAGNETTCGLLKSFEPPPKAGFKIDTDGAAMDVTFSGDCDPAKKIDGIVTAYIRIPIECPESSTLLAAARLTARSAKPR